MTCLSEGRSSRSMVPRNPDRTASTRLASPARRAFSLSLGESPRTLTYPPKYAVASSCRSSGLAVFPRSASSCGFTWSCQSGCSVRMCEFALRSEMFSSEARASSSAILVSKRVPETGISGEATRYDLAGKTFAETAVVQAFRDIAQKPPGGVCVLGDDYLIEAPETEIRRSRGIEEPAMLFLAHAVGEPAWFVTFGSVGTLPDAHGQQGLPCAGAVFEPLPDTSRLLRAEVRAVFPAACIRGRSQPAEQAVQVHIIPGQIQKSSQEFQGQPTEKRGRQPAFRVFRKQQTVAFGKFVKKDDELVSCRTPRKDVRSKKNCIRTNGWVVAGAGDTA